MIDKLEIPSRTARPLKPMRKPSTGQSLQLEILSLWSFDFVDHHFLTQVTAAALIIPQPRQVRFINELNWVGSTHGIATTLKAERSPTANRDIDKVAPYGFHPDQKPETTPPTTSIV